MEVLELDGKRYVKASKAAREAGYTSDYIGQLCRSGLIDAHLVGRSWYVDVDQLANHRIEKKRNSRIKAREQVKKELAARSQAKAESPVGDEHFRSRLQSVSYSDDTSELLPEVRKVTIQSTSSVKTRKEPVEEESNYEVENAGKHVVHTGTLVITDLSDEDGISGNERDTVILSPRIERKVKDRARVRVADIKPETIDTSDKVDTAVAQTSFLEKIEMQSESAATSTSSATDLIPKSKRRASAVSVLVNLLFNLLLLASLAIAILAPFVDARWNIGGDYSGVHFTFDFEKTLKELGL